MSEITPTTAKDAPNLKNLRQPIRSRFFPVLRAKKDFSSEREHAQRIDLLLKEVRSLKRDSWKYRDIGEIMQDSCSVDSKFK